MPVIKIQQNRYQIYTAYFSENCSVVLLSKFICCLVVSSCCWTQTFQAFSQIIVYVNCGSGNSMFITHSLQIKNLCTEFSGSALKLGAVHLFHQLHGVLSIMDEGRLSSLCLFAFLSIFFVSLHQQKNSCCAWTEPRIFLSRVSRSSVAEVLVAAAGALRLFRWPCTFPDFISRDFPSWTFHSAPIPPEMWQDSYYPIVVFKEKLTILHKIEMFQRFF